MSLVSPALRKSFAWVLLMAFAGFCSAEPGQIATRVAITDFSTDCCSYRDIQAADDFSLGVQSELTSQPSFLWVERARLKEAEAELKLSLYGPAAPDTALRSGKWAKADWSVIGEFVTVNDHRMLVLKIVDLNQAEILSERSLPMPATGRELLRGALTEIPKATQTIRQMLSEAEALRHERKTKKSIVLLSLLDRSRPYKRDDFRGSFDQALKKMAESSGHYVTRPLGASYAGGEASLTLSGLVELEPALWERVADQYVWGTFSIRERGHVASRNGKMEEIEREYILSPNVHVWNGQDAPFYITNSFASALPKPEAMEAIAGALADQIKARLNRQENQLVKADLRREVADMLLEQGKELEDIRAGAFFVQQDLESRGEMIRILESACFFDPANPVAQERRIMYSWPDSELYHGYNRFRFATRYSQAWKLFADSFGMDFLLTQANSNVVSHYLLSAIRPAQILASSSYDRQREGIPLDLNTEIIAQWAKDMGEELINRVIALRDLPEMDELAGRLLYPCFQVLERPEIITDPKRRVKLAQELWPIAAKGKADLASVSRDIVGIIRMLYRQCGLTGQEEELFKPLNKTSGSQIVALPRLGRPQNVEPKKPVLEPITIFRAAPLKIFMPELKPVIQWIDFGAGNDVKKIANLTFHSGRLWVVAAMNQEYWEPNSGKEQEQAKIGLPIKRLFLVDHSKLKLVPGLNPTNRLAALCAVQNELWACMQCREVYALDGEGFQSKPTRYLAPSMAAAPVSVVELGGTWYFYGGGPNLSTTTPKDTHWMYFPVEKGSAKPWLNGGTGFEHLSAIPPWLLLSSGANLLCNTTNRTWQDLDEKLTENAWSEDVGRVDAVANDRNSFWLGTDLGLHKVVPSQGTVANWLAMGEVSFSTSGLPETAQLSPRQVAEEESKRNQQHVDWINKQLGLRKARLTGKPRAHPLLPRSRLGGAVTGVAPDGEYLWLGVQERAGQCKVQLLHPETRRWLGGFPVPGKVTALSAAGDRLWIGFETSAENRNLLAEVNTTSLKNISRNHWKEDHVAKAEWEQQIKEMPVRS